MTLITPRDFKRTHFNGTVLIEVPAGTKLRLQDIGWGAYKVEGEQISFHVNETELKQLKGE